MNRFMETPDSSCAWQLVSELRAGYKDPKDFDRELHANLSLITENPDGIRAHGWSRGVA